jgi:hypothetical protein
MTAHASIGVAVLACQGLEMLFAMCVLLAFKHRDAKSFSEVTPLERNFTKPSMKQLLAKLGRYADVSDEFKGKVLDLIERRHVLIHRWGPLNGMPNTVAAHEKIGAFAIALSKDANALSDQLHKYVVQWMTRFPEVGEHLSSDQKAWLVSPPELKIEKA